MAIFGLFFEAFLAPEGGQKKGPKQSFLDPPFNRQKQELLTPFLDPQKRVQKWPKNEGPFKKTLKVKK